MGALVAFGLYLLGGVITYCGVYISRVIEYKKSGITYVNCDRYIEFYCEKDGLDILMYLFWPITIIISFSIFVFELVFKLISETICDGIKTLIKKLLKVE